MRLRPFLAHLVLSFVACEAKSVADGDAETGGEECADDPGLEGCPCDDGTACVEGLSCMEDATCGCADPSHLGCPCEGDDDCGAASCVEGSCQPTCDPNVDLMTDVANCGECGRACPDAAGACRDGKCFGASAYGECFVPGGDVACDDQCQQQGPAFFCADDCVDGGWAGFDIPSCTDTPAQTGTCAAAIANPFASAQCCCAELLD